ncbi:MAG: hypothetical protein CMJ14_06965 [Pelagibacterales bacterium]|nr:hypothetical protein [Pelagibacterales bacterium]|tara:strand:- start:1754 stop:2449 length:696 start_codon:yes stop_codon:yes gene_type:complete
MKSLAKKKDYEILNNDNGLYKIVLNGVCIKTPKGNSIDLPNLKSAKLLVKRLKKNNKNKIIDEIKITYTAIDKVALNKQKYIKEVLQVLSTDTIVFISDNQEKLYSKQKKYWEPLILWINEKFDLDLKHSSNLQIQNYSLDKNRLLNSYINKFSIYELSALISLTSLTNSLIISIALIESKINYNQAFRFSFLEELFQASIWGKDKEAYSRLNSIKLDIKLVKYYFDSIKN